MPRITAKELKPVYLNWLRHIKGRDGHGANEYQLSHEVHWGWSLNRGNRVLAGPCTAGQMYDLLTFGCTTCVELELRDIGVI